MLLHYGPSLDVEPDRLGRTPLSIASARGFSEIAVVLLQHGARVDTEVGNLWNSALERPESGTALHVAASSGHAKTVEVLLQHRADVHARSEHGQTPLAIAMEEGNKEVVELLLVWVAALGS